MLQINGGSETANQVDVLLNLSADDDGSGVADARISNNGSDWSSWQVYADVIPWTLPTLDRRTHTVYVQVRDKAGNESAIASDDIYLELYPPMPHSANYRICADVIDAGGSAGITSTGYSLVSAIGQPWGTGAVANSSAGFGERAGFLSSITGCLPISLTATSEFSVTQWVVASGGNLRGSASYRLGDTTGQPAASGGNAFSSTNYSLSSGFWSQITGTVPPTTTIQPTPVPPTPTPTPTPGPTPTPQPDSFGVSINAEAAYANDPLVTVRAWAPNVTQMRLSNDESGGDAGWMTYQLTSTWTLSTSGSYVTPRYVYAWFQDATGRNVYGPYSDNILYDPVAPQGKMMILGSEFVTVTLWLEAYDDNSGVEQMRVGEDINLTAAIWQPYTHTITWTLQSPVVYAQFRDRAGNESAVYGSDGSTYWPDSRVTDVVIGGPATGFVRENHVFSAIVSPLTATLPITFVWQAAGQPPVTHTGRMAASDQISLTWDSPGVQYIHVAAANRLGAASDTYSITLGELAAQITKTVVPTGPLSYGDALTYTLVLSSAPGEQVGLYDPLQGVTFERFVTRPSGVTRTLGFISGTLTAPASGQVSVTFVARVGVPGTAGVIASVTNRACVYDPAGTLRICRWSEPVTNPVTQPRNIFLPLVLRQWP